MKEPKIRFKGVEGEWERNNAEKIFNTVNERNYPNLPVLSATQDKGMIIRKDIGFNVFHNVSNEVSYKHVLPGQFVIHLRSFQGGFAHPNIEGIASPAYTILKFRTEEKHNDIFWKYVLSSKNFIKRLTLITYGIRDGRSISYNEFKEMSFIYPIFEEQQKIATYFQSLDAWIQATEKKLASLRQIKEASLQAMFPQEGETTPKVRFKGFEGEWKKTEISQKCNVTTGKSNTQDQIEDGLYPFYIRSEKIAKSNKSQLYTLLYKGFWAL